MDIYALTEKNIISKIFSSCISCSNQVVTVRNEIRTSIIKKSINPIWSDVLECNILSTDLSSLCKLAHICISVWDHDDYKKDDLIGSLEIPFVEILNSIISDQVFEFQDLKVISNGIQSGTLSGQIRLNNLSDLMTENVSNALLYRDTSLRFL